VIVRGGSPPVLVPYCVAMLKVTLLVVYTSPDVSGVWGREGFSSVTGLAGPTASSPIISPSSLRWNGSTFSYFLGYLFHQCHSYSGAEAFCFLGYIGYCSRDAI
jgi:hypothetical protein